LSATYNAAGGNLPTKLVAKVPFASHSDMLARMSIYENEVRFYRDVLPLVDIKAPALFAYDSDPETGYSIVVLEDLRERGVVFTNARIETTYEWALDVVRALARLHAKWWDKRAPFPWLSPGRHDDGGSPYEKSQRTPEAWAENMARPRGIPVPRRFRDLDEVGRGLDRMKEIDRGSPSCLLHGDAHVGNLYVDVDGRAGFLDWQTVRRGGWAHDINYFIVSALDIEDRRLWEQDLLRAYLAELGKVAPAFEAAWDHYRVYDYYGFFFWTVNPPSMQPEDLNQITSMRFAIAALDHETPALLGL
jgi:aminoglycoside phosphotransferase (APT) family kinase protein